MVDFAKEDKMEMIKMADDVQLPFRKESSLTTKTFHSDNRSNDRRDIESYCRDTEPALPSCYKEGTSSRSDHNSIYQETTTGEQQPTTLQTSRSLLQPLPLAMDNVMRTMESCTSFNKNTSGLNSIHHPLYHSQSMPPTSRSELYTNGDGEGQHESCLDISYGHHAHNLSYTFSSQTTPSRSHLPKYKESSAYHDRGSRGHAILPNALEPESPVSAIQLGSTGGTAQRFYNTNHGTYSMMAPPTISVPLTQLNAGLSISGDERSIRRYARTNAGSERRSPPPPTKRGPGVGGQSGGNTRTRVRATKDDLQSGHQEPGKSNSHSPRISALKPHSPKVTGMKPHSPRITGSKPTSTHGGLSGQGSTHSHSQNGAGCNSNIPVHNHGPRTPPEVLKTLLRKKACLYEAGGTSYAIALVTWLVGRELTLRSGYFTRQELQYGVHNVVGEIIESGNITRTKVNRCMQIILNSCFHYIIPSVGTGSSIASPSGGDGSIKDLLSAKKFRDDFASRAANDEDLLWTLDAPWQGLDIDDAFKGLTYERGGRVNSPPGSPKSSSHQTIFHAPTLNEASTQVDDDESSLGSSKKVVLLCFNENVNSFEEAWRCHNEFIRDVAHTENLRLTAKEWKDFYSRVSQTQGTASTSVGAPHYSPSTNSRSGGTLECSSSEDGSRLSPATKGSLLRPVHGAHEMAEFSLDEGFRPSHSYAAAAASSIVKKSPTDLDSRFASMSIKDLNAFRTTWCSKRYDHDHAVCSFAHVEVNGGWLRRDPNLFEYSSEFCPNVEVVQPNDQHLLEGCIINKCPKGVRCPFCHSQEELDYHPDRYKKQDICSSCKDASVLSNPFDTCLKGFVCPFLHTPTQHAHQISGRGFHLERSHRRPARNDGGGSRHGKSHLRTKTKGTSHTGTCQEQAAAETCSTLYIDPAPLSEMEGSLGLPGLRLLFRQRCAACVQQLIDKSVLSYASF